MLQCLRQIAGHPPFLPMLRPFKGAYVQYLWMYLVLSLLNQGDNPLVAEDHEASAGMRGRYS